MGAGLGLTGNPIPRTALPGGGLRRVVEPAGRRPVDSCMPRRLVPVLAALVIAGCDAPPGTPVDPTVSLQLSAQRITVGESVTLSWNVTEAEQCSGGVQPAGGGDFDGTLPVAAAGSRVVQPAAAGSYTYRVHCSGGGGASASATAVLEVATPDVVPPPPPPVPVRRFTAADSIAYVGEPLLLAWQVDDATACGASGAWQGARPVQGTETFVAAAPGELTLTLSCAGAGTPFTATIPVLAVTRQITLSRSFAPAASTISSGEGAPYGDADFWFGPELEQSWLGYGPTRVVRTYICLNGMVSLGECSSHPPPAFSLSSDMVNGVEAGLAAYEGSGVRLLVRFVYNFGPAGALDAPMDVILAHIDQLMPVLLRHRDLIFALEAGFIGTWGEWHTSTNGNTAPAEEDRLLDALTGWVRGAFPILLRYPADLLRYTGTTIPTPGLGLHDDYWASDGHDGGTWLPRDGYGTTALHDYAEAVARSTMFVAEFGAQSPSQQTCAALDAYARQIPIQSLSLGIYPPEIATAIAAQGCLLDFLNRVGTRIELDRVTLEGDAVAGATLTGTLSLRNGGYGRVVRARPATLVIHRGGAVWREVPLPLATVDLRGLAPLAASPTTVPFSITLPESLPGGPVSLSIVFPDPAATLRGDPDYALPLNSTDSGGVGVFDHATGWNHLATIVVRPRDAAGGATAVALAGARVRP